MTAPIDPARCPLCGEANQCQLAAGRPTCWCFETPVPAAVLARVPLAAQGIACVCKRCATGDEAERRRRGLQWTKR
jgi:hypothetical protein